MLASTLRKQAQLDIDMAAEPVAAALLQQARADAYPAPEDRALVVAAAWAAGARVATGRLALSADEAREAREALAVPVAAR